MSDCRPPRASGGHLGTFGGALAAVTMGVLQMAFPDLRVPPGFEAGLAVLTTLAIGWWSSGRKRP